MTADYTTRFKAAVVQAEPVWFDLAATVDKTVALIEEASANGADLIAFPETWIPGYPWFLWLDSVAWQSRFFVTYPQNSLTLDGPEFSALREAARGNDIAVALGFSERSHGSLYMGQAVIDRDGTVVRTRRKLKPTHVERTLFGEGDGSDLTVDDTSLGRVGSLCCWEHLQPLSKYALYSQHEQVHIAAWPSFSIFPGSVYALGPEVNTAASQQYAVEGQTYVLAPCAVVGDAGWEAFADTETKRQLIHKGGGYARIYGPDGRSLADPLAPTEEGVLYADIDLAAILAAKNPADPVGHYSRPDVLRLMFDPAPRPKVDLLTPQQSAPLGSAPSEAVGEGSDETGATGAV
ncbi:carbon-nitrogen hydrolase family protein [Nocardiopsis dassonvillei]|uniref:carbon-nitrogen hydrolase family protein n=1 Tax=Nocardiopsis dassonvillei TaxID=2014 RepID=UPI0020A455D8|nr:carbon-nitrogen hydrolase family protein [Nocardiopsis dassonvillei]MCP3013867.1 carbon-nitrogen hydrolase family protein [Nocardiopsis dassonvillei]